MLQILQYYARYHSFRSRVSRFPSWARLILLIFALPGILAAALSILALIVSILALLLLTSPVYRLLAWLSGSGAPRMEPVDEQPPPARRHVDVTIIENP
jgi:hypothetical protein